MSSVTLINGKVFEADSNSTILDSAINQGVFLEYSCRTGRCGICKTKVISGQTTAIKPEESLTGEDIDAGKVLTCCRAAVSDVTLQAEDLGVLVDYPSKTIPCRIDSLTMLTSNVLEVILRFPPGQSVRYLAGQYIDVIGQNGLRRSYSIANAPREDGRIILYIKRVEYGVMSDYWFNKAAINDLLRIEGPLGTFFLRDHATKTIALLATGTGIAPVKALLEHLDSNSHLVVNKKIIILWGNRVPEDIFWKPLLENIEVSFLPTLSRAPDGWNGAKGYVQDLLFENPIEVNELTVYACGSEEMIQSAKKVLFAAGLPDARLHSDAFVSSN